MEPGTIAAVGSLVLLPFGPMQGLLSQQNPWRGFDAKDANLVVVRIERTKGDCARWSAALAADKPGVKVSPEMPLKDQPEVLKAWEPWNEEELSDIRDCKKFPCHLKMNEAEVGQMKAAPEAGRVQKFWEIVMARAGRYQKTQERKEYEFPGDPVEPWKYLESKGFKGDQPMPGTPELWIRKLDLAPGKAKVIHQVVDRRVVHQKVGTTFWLRDAYSDHFFDGWGEWTQVQCEEAAGNVLVVQALFGELDLLKENDLLSRLMRGKMRSSFESQGGAFLDLNFERLKKAASGG